MQYDTAVGSRDVVDHVTIGLAVYHLILQVVHWHVKDYVSDGRSIGYILLGPISHGCRDMTCQNLTKHIPMH